MSVGVKLLCSGIFWDCGMACSNSLFTITPSCSHRCLAGKLSCCQPWYFPLYWTGNGLSGWFNWPSYMYMIKWWHPFNKHWTEQLEIDSWQISQHRPAIKPIQLSCLPGLLSQRRVSSKLSTAHQADNDGKNAIKTCVASEMLAGWERQKPEAKMRGQSGSPRNSKTSCITELWWPHREGGQKTPHLRHVQRAFLISLKAWFLQMFEKEGRWSCNYRGWE